MTGGINRDGEGNKLGERGKKVGEKGKKLEGKGTTWRERERER